MMDLSKLSLLLGVAVGVLHVPMLVAPSSARRFLAGFPRNRWFAWVLTAVDLAWAAWLLSQVPLGRFDTLKDYLPVLTPVAFFAIVFFVDELLAARALGGLLVLIPSPLLDAARWHASPIRLVMVVLAYVLVIEGVVLLLSPYWFRRAVGAMITSDKACRMAGAAGLLLGTLLVVLGLTVY